MKATAEPSTTGYTSFEIDTYHCKLFAREGNVASINLRDAAGKTFAIAIFKPDTESLPSQYKGSDGIHRVFYHRSGLPDVIDVLRHEKPVYFHYWLPDGHNTHIGTAFEPVGEGETP